MNRFLEGVDRASMLKWTAIYLVVYAVLNACGGLVFGVLGGLAAGVGALGAATSGFDSSGEAAAATSALTAIGGLSVVLALLYVISVPFFAVAAFGLWRRKAWGRMAAVIALGFSILISLVSFSSGFTNIIWIVVSAAGIYFYLTDEGLKHELSG